MEAKVKQKCGRKAKPDRNRRSVMMSDAVFKRAELIGGGNSKASDGIEVAIMAYQIDNQALQD
jgi:hypothetical protein